MLESDAPDNEKGIAGLTAFDNRLVTKPPMNPIEQQIKRAIERLGILLNHNTESLVILLTLWLLKKICLENGY